MEFGYVYSLTYKDLTYYGSSIRLPRERYSKHKYDRRCSSKILFEEAEKNGEEPTMEILFCFTYDCEKCRRIKEQWFIDNHTCVNIHSAYCENKRESWIKRNPEKYKEAYTKSYIKNREEIIAKRRKAYQDGKRKKWCDLTQEEKDTLNARRKELRHKKKM